MRIRTLLLGLTLPLLGACAAESGDTSDTASPDRGGLGKADLVGSCEAEDGGDFCGGPGTGNCFCDDACLDFGDCCHDADTVCGLEDDDDDDDDEATFCGGFLGETCGDDEYCAYEEGDFCGLADASSTCEPRPEACIALFDPVCGCDGETYSNSCFAAAAGTGVMRNEPCESDEPQCQPVLCELFCENGFATDENGCEVCSCAEPECQPVLCELFCENGFATDEDGCEVCSCAEPEPEPCHVGGCNGELCVGPDGPDASICIALPWAACFELSSCGNNGEAGACGWDMNEEFVQCMTSLGGM